MLHIAPDFTSHLNSCKALLKKSSVIGRVLVIFADYVPNHSIHPVLKNGIAVRDPPRALMVLPAFGKPTLKSAPAGTDSRDYVAVKKAVKKTLSWAEIAQK